MRFNSTRFSESPSLKSMSYVLSELWTRVTLPLYHFPRFLKSASTASPSRGFFDERRSSSESESRDLMNSSLTRVSCSPSSSVWKNR